MLQGIADWHGEQAANAYSDWQESQKQDDLNRYLYHIRIADKMWG